MTRLRLLVWLLSLVALVAPPGMTLHAMASPAEMAAVDCPDHAPPPHPCPDEGTAKHAASTCCPLMAGVVALLPPAVLAQTSAPFHAGPAAPTASLAGLVHTQDPPPPRV
jgi:hypothetical protein